MATDLSQTSAPPRRIGVLLCNLGTPDSPEPAAVRRYLAEFLGDRRVVELPRLLWKPILHGIVLVRRPKESAQKYRKVWIEGEGSPLLVYTQRQATMLRGWLGEAGVSDVDVQVGMRYGQPGITTALEQWQRQGIAHMLVVPLYPQYSGTTTASVVDAVNAWCGRQRNIPALRIVRDYATDAGYLRALEHSVTRHWQKHGRPDHLVLSFHGIPQRNVALGDPYAQQCLQTAGLLAQRLNLAPTQYSVTFQSRFGPAKWLQPYTQPTVEALARNGIKTIDVLCPGFASDCLETLEEINMEVRHAFLANGGREFRYIPCLNDDPVWIDALRNIVLTNLAGWRTDGASAHM
ncbi:ferrochelatase [Lampropedia cohaerens]|uniref:Ferrochelatase n=1 Tax=Lampropedia cohaerens TaxID=1610491 RepID=A0A0U1PWU9_9BURK|nr:ferrochelatase [Lampropedia cohaerens]KKW66999.1 ferrochelatase [Lampropedia cohaerens]